jgi:hypothetical protein
LPEVTGTAQLRDVRAMAHGVNGPIEISSAELKLMPDGVRVDKLNARAAGSNWTGSLALPRGCGTPSACLVRFNLSTEEIGLGNLHEWLASKPSQRRWYQMLTPAEPATSSFLQNLRASGRVSAARLLIHDVVASQASASLEMEHGKLTISDWRADVLGGKHRGDWQIDFAGVTPLYTGTGSLTAVALEEISDAIHDPWISGMADGTYQVAGSGVDSAAFWQSAVCSLQFDLRDVVLSHILLATDEGPLHVTRWQGRARLQNGQIEIEPGKLVVPGGTYDINGTASLGRMLDFKLARGADLKQVRDGAVFYSITGTVQEPLITVNSSQEAQAQLK